MKKIFKWIKKRSGSRTYRVGLLISILTILEANQHVLVEVVPVTLQPYMPIMIPIVFLILREKTQGPVGEGPKTVTTDNTEA